MGDTRRPWIPPFSKPSRTSRAEDHSISPSVRLWTRGFEALFEIFDTVTSTVD
jgi:hypothetical protein